MNKDVDHPPLFQQQNEISTYPLIGDWLRKLWPHKWHNTM